jgi:hypothetical protein
VSDVCNGCGEPNPPGTQFCLFCGIYLGWDERTQGEEAAGGLPVDESEAPATVTRTPVPPGPDPQPPAGRQATEVVLSEPDRPGAHQAQTAAEGRAAHECPDCGRLVGPERRFCGHCGRVMAHGVRAPRPARRQPRWWQRLLRSDTRRARRAYRRALPPLYRWRRVGLAALFTALVMLGFTVVGRDPVGWAMDRWYDVTGRLEPVVDVVARAVPQESVVDEQGASGLVDADPGSAWVTEWSPPAEPATCGEAPGGRVVLTFPERRVRELHVLTGVTNPSERLLQHIPTQLHVELADGSCRSVVLTRSPESQEVPFHTDDPVSELTVSIAEAHRSDDERVEDVAGLSSLTVIARPGR